MSSSTGQPSEATLEILRVCAALPPEKQRAVAEFARSLLAPSAPGESALQGEVAGDQRWEQIIAEETPRPRLAQFLQESAQEEDEPLDLERM